MLPLVWRFGLLGLAVISIILGLWVIRKSIYETGFSACSAIYENKKHEYEAIARSKIIELDKEYDSRIKELEEIGDSSPVGPATSLAIDRL